MELQPSGRRAAAARHTMQALSGGLDVFETFFERVPIGLALADLSGRFVRVNDTYADLLGHAPEDLIGVAVADVLPGLGEHPGLGPLLAGQQVDVALEERYVTPGGLELWVLHGAAVVRDADGEAIWLAVSAQDVTERRRAEQDLRELTSTLTERAVRDPLTGLANRTLLEERLRAALSRDARTGRSSAVLFLDLDGFKAVNDRFGHAVGDEVLSAIARRLADSVRPSDTVARLGGDEFVVLCEGTGPDDLDALVARLRRVVSEPVRAGGRTLTVGVSVGKAVSARGAADPARLVADADRAMYAEKRERADREPRTPGPDRT